MIKSHLIEAKFLDNQKLLINKQTKIEKAVGPQIIEKTPVNNTKPNEKDLKVKEKKC